MSKMESMAPDFNMPHIRRGAPLWSPDGAGNQTINHVRAITAQNPPAPFFEQDFYDLQDKQDGIDGTPISTRPGANSSDQPRSGDILVEIRRHPLFPRASARNKPATEPA